MNYLRLMLAAVPTLLLTACVETQNVSTFAASVVVVTDATTKMVASDRATCVHIAGTVAEIEALPLIGKIADSPNCAKLGTALDAVAGVNEVLGNYGKALGNISQGTFVNYDSDVTALQGILKSLPAADQPTADQITAVTGLAGWIASLATQERRDKAIRAAMVGQNGEMGRYFSGVVGLLDQLVAHYSEALAIDAKITDTSIGLVRHNYVATEPVAVEEFTLRMRAAGQASGEQTTAIKNYSATLDAMTKAFDAATKQPTAKEMLTEVRDFGKQARTLDREFTKAFPNR